MAIYFYTSAIEERAYRVRGEDVPTRGTLDLLRGIGVMRVPKLAVAEVPAPSCKHVRELKA